MIDQHLKSEAQEAPRQLLPSRVRHLFLARGRLQADLHRLYHPAQPRIDYEVTAKEFLGQMVQPAQRHLN